ncbi:MAG: glycosyltransferase family 2 protein [Rhodospirillaceae bacterium]|nr:glycosyltransferase family 2 protein [Rhodospirillaceae bacterium]
MAGHQLGVIIPALNEGTTIAAIVAAAGRYGVVIVVNDGSTDNTAEQAQSAGAVVVSNQHSTGYEPAIEAGFQEAENRGLYAAVTLDADGEHDPIILAEFRKHLIDEDVALVIGRRCRPQRFAEWVMGHYCRRQFAIRDVLCGMKGYHMRLYVENSGFDHWRSVGTELAVASILRGCEFREVDVVGKSRQGKPRYGGALRANLKILGALYRLIRLKDQVSTV